MSTRSQTKARAPSEPIQSSTLMGTRFVRQESLFGGTPGFKAEFAESRTKLLVSQPQLIQPKLIMGQPRDKYEQEADRVADQVLSMPKPQIFRQAEEEEEEERIQTKPVAERITPLVQRQVEEEEEEIQAKPLQRQEAEGEGLSPDLQLWITKGEPKVRQAFKALSGEEPNPRLAYWRLQVSLGVLRKLAEKYPNQLAEPGVLFEAINDALEPHAGVTHPLMERKLKILQSRLNPDSGLMKTALDMIRSRLSFKYQEAEGEGQEMMPAETIIQRQEEEEEQFQTKSIVEQITPFVQRQAEEEEEEEVIQSKPISQQITPLLQRQVEPEEEEEEEPIQAKMSNDEQIRIQEAKPEEEAVQTNRASTKNPEEGLDFEEKIHSLKSGGQPLPESTRKFFEPHFGYNFSPVRLHTDNQAAALARAMKAKAFTIGKNLFFDTGKYSPDTTQGKNLLAHELAHVIQQGHAEPLSQTDTVSMHSPQLKSDAGKERRNPEPGNRIGAVHSKTQNIVQCSPATKIVLVERPKPIDIKPAGKNTSRVYFLGTAIATVKNFGPGELKLKIHQRVVSEGPDKPPWLHIVMGCFPNHQIYPNESAKESLSELGYNIIIEVELVGIEQTGGVESGIPHVPRRIPEPLIVTPSEKEEVPTPPSEPKEPEKSAPTEETAPKPSPKPKEPDITPEDKEKTELERKQIKDLLNTAVHRMLLGVESESLVNEAAEKAASILKRKTAAFDPEVATEKIAQELIEAVEGVKLLPGGDEAAIERAMNKTLRWAEIELKRAVEKLPKTPKEAVGKEAVGKEVAEKACRVMVLGGDATEAMDLLMAIFPPSARKAPSGKSK